MSVKPWLESLDPLVKIVIAIVEFPNGATTSAGRPWATVKLAKRS